MNYEKIYFGVNYKDTIRQPIYLFYLLTPQLYGNILLDLVILLIFGKILFFLV